MPLSPGEVSDTKGKTMRTSSREEMSPETLRSLYGIRFHHFNTHAGRLVATVATEPLEANPDGSEDILVSVSAAVCSPLDTPSRARGRQIALGRLETGRCENIPLSLLKRRISDRSILDAFIPDGLARRLGYADTADLLSDLRPRRTFTEQE